MNKIYKLVEQFSLQYQTSASALTSRERQSAVSIGALLLGGTLYFPISGLHAAEPVPANGDTRVYDAGNGVPIVDIATANSKGLSHNVYDAYNVPTQGLILNNNSAVGGAVPIQSLLAGQVMPNLNLDNEASVILNEVVSANRSVLEGFTEVVGGRADVVVANPWGITVSGGGFINTDRVSLVTGAPVIGGGELTGFTVQGGDVLITGTGANLSAQSMFELVARSITVDGNINVDNGDLKLTAGSNDWDYTTGVATPITSAGPIPTYAIDSTALGGMYAERIQLISTEAGAGVRMLAESEAAASADDFIITADGKIEVLSSISAEQNLILTSRNTQAGAITLSDASLSAKQRVELSAASGGAVIDGGAISSGNVLVFTLDSLKDSATDTGTTDNNIRYASGAVDINVSGAVDLTDVTYGAGNTLDLQADSVQVSSGATSLYTQSGDLSVTTMNDMSFADAAIVAYESDLLLTSVSGLISTSAGLNQGVQAKLGNVSVQTSDDLQNSGVISADNGKLQIDVDGVVTNSDVLHGDTLTMNVGKLNNQSEGIILGDGLTIVTASTIDNQGVIIASNTADQSGVVNTGTLTNGGTIQSADTLTLNVATVLQNAKNILAERDLVIQGTAAGTLNVANNTGATLQSGTVDNYTVTISGVGGSDNVTVSNLGDGKIIGDALDLDVLTLTNEGVIQSKTTGNVAVTGVLGNTGRIMLSADDGAGTLTAGTLNNTGAVATDGIYSNGSLDIDITGTSLNNQSRIYASDALTITGSGASLTIDNDGLIQAGASADTNNGDDVLTLNGLSTMTLNNLSNGVVRSDQLNLNLLNLTNSGTIQANGLVSVTIKDSLKNNADSRILFYDTTDGNNTVEADVMINSGLIHSDGSLALTGTTSIRNNINGVIQSAGSMAGTSRNLKNLGTIQSSVDLFLNVDTALDNDGGSLLASKNLTIGPDSSGALTNQNGGVIRAGSTLRIDNTYYDADLNNGADSLIVGNDVFMNLSNFDNAGTIKNVTGEFVLGVKGGINHATGNILSGISADGLTQSSADLSLWASTFQNDGLMFSVGDMTASVNTRLTNNGEMYSGQGLLIDDGWEHGLTLVNSGKVIVDGALSIRGYDNSGAGIIVTNSDTLQAGKVDITADSLTVNGGEGILSVGDMNLILGTLVMPETDSTIVGGGRSTMTVDNYLTNNGTIFSTQDLILTASDGLLNEKTALIAALSDVTISLPWNRDFYNEGALYSGDVLSVNAGNFTNEEGGTVNSDAKINFDIVRDFTNYNNIIAKELVDIEADGFYNKIAGGDQRVWLPDYPDPHTVTVGDWGYDFTGSSGERTTAEIWTSAQSYMTPPRQEDVPQIIATAGDVSLTFNSGYNLAGLIIAAGPSGDVTMTPSKAGASFINDDYSLTQHSYSKTITEYSEGGFLAFSETVIPSRTTNSTIDTPTFMPSTLNQGIYASGNFAASGMSVTQQGVPGSKPESATDTGAAVSVADSPNTSAAGIDPGTGTSTTAISAVTAQQGVNADVDVSAEGPSSSTPITFNGLSIFLPSNPNGYFVPSKDPESNYLVETNPLFQVGSALGVSTYFAGLGYDPELLQKRLGDAYYEEHLIREQLFAQGAAALLGVPDLMESLMVQGSQEATRLGLDWGVAPTAEQLANLTEDIVWMVEVTVMGQRVLAPQVFLTQETKSGLLAGAVISATNINMDVTSLTNTGGSIVAKKELNVTSKHDITNTSGLLKGGDVKLISTEGSIVNQTWSTGSGSDLDYVTTVGKTAAIESDNMLILDAKDNIEILGAIVKAGDGFFTAGGDILEDTIVDKNITTTHEDEGDFDFKHSTTTKTSINNLASSVDIGGNLTTKSGGDTTIAGSKLKVAGGWDHDTGGDLNIVDRHDEERTVTTTTTVNWFGSENEDPDNSSGDSEDPTLDLPSLSASASAEGDESVSSKNNLTYVEVKTTTHDTGTRTSLGSDINIGGAITGEAAETVRISGSSVHVGVDSKFKAKNIEITSGKNEAWDNTTVARQSIGIYEESEAEASGEVNAEATATMTPTAMNASASAEGSASAESTQTAGVRTQTDATTDVSVTNTRSDLTSDGSLSFEADETLLFKGANVEAAVDINQHAKDILNKAVQDTHYTSTDYDQKTGGLYVSGSASAEGSAEASAQTGAITGIGGGVSGKVEGEGSAGLRYTQESANESLNTQTQLGNSFKSGGNTARIAENTILDEKTDGQVGGTFKQSAATIIDQAVYDVTTATSGSSYLDARLGVYAGGEAEVAGEAVTATAGRNTSDAGAGGEASAGFTAKLDMNDSSESSTTKTAQSSSFKVRGDYESTSSGKTQLEGTNIDVGGNAAITGSSVEITAAYDSSSSDATTNDVSVDAKFATHGSSGGKLDASYEGENNTNTSRTAKVGSVSSDGGLVIKSTAGDVVLEGTQLEGESVMIDAKEGVEFKAAHNIETNENLSGSAAISLSDTKGNTGHDNANEGMNIGGNIEGSDQSSDAAVVGSINAGAGGIAVITGGDVTLEGTQIDSTGKTVVDAGGDVNLNAAKSTTSDLSGGVSVDVMKEEKGPGLYKGGDAEGGGGGGVTYEAGVTSTKVDIQSTGGVEISAGSGSGTIVNQEAVVNSDGGDVTYDGVVVEKKADDSLISVGVEAEYKTDASTDSNSSPKADKPLRTWGDK